MHQVLLQIRQSNLSAETNITTAATTTIICATTTTTTGTTNF